MSIKIPAFSIVGPSKIYPNWDFWFENIPFGNPWQNHLRTNIRTPASRNHNGLVFAFANLPVPDYQSWILGGCQYKTAPLNVFSLEVFTYC
jgi:hypothetical protein